MTPNEFLSRQYGRSAATTYEHLRENGITATVAILYTRAQVAELGSGYPGGLECTKYRRLYPGKQIRGTYSKLPFSGTIYHVDSRGYIYVILDEPYHRNLPAARIKTMTPISTWNGITNTESFVLCSFRPTDKNITIQ